MNIFLLQEAVKYGLDVLDFLHYSVMLSHQLHRHSVLQNVLKILKSVVLERKFKPYEIKKKK